MRGGRTSAFLILFMIILGMGLITVYYMYKTVTTVHNMIQPQWLAEEIGSKYVLTMAQYDLRPGQVYEVTPDKQGWQIKQKDTKLYDILTLKNIDLSLNDVIAPHLDDWYFNGIDNSISPSHENITVNNYVNVTIGWYAESQEHVLGVISPLIISWFKLYNDNALTGTGGIYIAARYNAPQSFTFWTQNATNYNWQLTKQFDTGWHTHSFTFDGKTIAIYEDGKLIGSVDRPDTIVFNKMQIAGNILAQRLKGKVAYLVISDSSSLKILLDPSFFNGTYYFDIISNSLCTPNGVTRIPAEKKWLWYISNIESDNKIHFMYFPEGTVIKILDGSGNIIREFTITGEHAGNTTQVQDYTISLPSTSLPDVTVEAYVPAQEIRVYGPPGAMVEIVSDGVIYGAKEIPYYGYVDLNLTEPLDNAYIIVYADDKDENLNIDLKDLGGGKYRVTVSNTKGIVLPNMLVIVRDPSNAVVGYGVTDDSGTTTIDVGHPLPSITIEVHGIFDDKLYEASKDFTLATTENADIQATTPSSSSNMAKYALLGLGAIVLVAAVIVAARRR